MKSKKEIQEKTLPNKIELSANCKPAETDFNKIYKGFSLEDIYHYENLKLTKTERSN